MFSRKTATFSCTDNGDSPSAETGGCACHSPALHLAARRIAADLSRRGFLAGAGASVAALGLPSRAAAQGAPVPPRPVVFTNFRLFDGTSPGLRDGLSLLVDGSRIKAVATGQPTPPEGARVIDCGGRVIMPGLIDAHWHALFAAVGLGDLLNGSIGPVYLAAGVEAERTLMRGFTTVRDLGGPVFAFKQAIDQGVVPGPRIYPSGAMITTTGGHGDLRPLSDLPRSPGGPPSALEETGGAAIADSADEVRLRVREQLLQGASQIKIVGGGGVSSPRSPLDMSTFTEGQVRAAVETAADWNTFVTVHAYAPTTIRRAVAAGAKCIEHGHLMDDATAEMIASHDVWLSTQPFLSKEDTVPLSGPSLAASLQVFAGTDSAYRLAIKHGIKTAFGSDLLFSAALTPRQGVMLGHLAHWYSGSEILKMATSANGELLALSGPRNPYPGKLGVIEDGAYADLLLVDGNPIDDIGLLADPDRSLLLIMKDGAIYKDKVPLPG